jgi:hypothetical protein
MQASSTKTLILFAFVSVPRHLAGKLEKKGSDRFYVLAAAFAKKGGHVKAV